jgi:O-antigen/teichoic acid export membrane protein
MLKFSNIQSYTRIAIVASVATVISAALNFLYNVIVGRYLGPEAFGLLASLLSILGIFTISTSGFQIATAKEVAKNKSVKSLVLLDTWTLKIIYFGLISVLFFLMASPLIARLLNTSTQISASICLGGLAASVFSVAIGRLQGSSKFVEWQLWGVFATLLKVLGGLTLTLLGLSVFFFPISLAIVGIIVAFLIIYRTRTCGKVNLKFKSSAVVSSSISMTLLWIITQFDIIFSRSQFSMNESGLYAAAVTLSKSIPVAVGLAGAIMLPKVAKKTHEGKTSNKEILSLAFVSFFIGSIMVLVVVLFRVPLILNLFGSQYSGATEILLLSAVSSIPWCVTVALVQARLGSHEKQVSAVLAIGTISSILCAYLFATTLDILITISGITGLVMALWLLSLNRIKIGVK